MVKPGERKGTSKCGGIVIFNQMVNVGFFKQGLFQLCDLNYNSQYQTSEILILYFKLKSKLTINAVQSPQNPVYNCRSN